MNYEALLQLYRSRSVFRKLLDTIAAEGLDENRTIVEELVDGETSRRVVVNLLRDLTVMGCGEFKVGRKGHPSRFNWNVDPHALRRRLAMAANAGSDGEDDEAAEVEADDEHDNGEHDDEAVEVSEPVQATLGLDHEPLPGGYVNGRSRPHAPTQPTRTATEVIPHHYVLRRDLRVTLELPSDLSRREAEVLAAWVRELSFDR